MRRAFEAYQYVAPALLTPLAAWLWWRHYDGHVALAAIALVVPIAAAQAALTLALASLSPITALSYVSGITHEAALMLNSLF